MPPSACGPAALYDAMMAWRAALHTHEGQEMYEDLAHARFSRDERTTESRMATEEVAGFHRRAFEKVARQ